MDQTAEAPAEPLSPESANAAELHGVTRRFGDVVALSELSLSVSRGEVLAVVGPSGCGKSTLLELLAGLQAPDAGAVQVRGETSLMPQSDLLLPWRDALANAGPPLECQRVPKKEARRRAEPLFERFGLGQFEHSYPAELSGG